MMKRMQRAVALLTMLLFLGAAPAGAREYWTERGGTVPVPTVAAPNWVEIAKQVKPAVVSVTTKLAAEQGTPSMDDLFRNGPPAGHHPMQGRGSGFIITADGFILTNNHVVENASSVQVTLSDGRQFTAKVIGQDPKTDIALIKIQDAGSLPVVPVGDSDALQVGEPVLAIGNPFGLEQTVTTGIISGLGRVIGGGPYDDFIQTDASINPGNSGGPLVNPRGEAVGINTAIFSRTGGSVGIGFAIPVNIAKFVVPQLAEHGSVTRGWLGVTVQPLTEDLAKSFAVPDENGALVAGVQPDSPAARAGIKPGDVIVEFDGHKVGRTTDLSRIVAATPVGHDAKVALLRDGTPVNVTAHIAQLQEKTTEAASAGEPTSRGKLGVVVEPVTPDVARDLGLPPTAHGLVVRSVREGSPAEDAGLRPGDVITEVNRQPVRTPEDLRHALEAQKPGTPLLLQVQREGAALFLTARV